MISDNAKTAFGIALFLAVFITGGIFIVAHCSPMTDYRVFPVDGFLKFIEPDGSVISMNPRHLVEYKRTTNNVCLRFVNHEIKLTYNEHVKDWDAFLSIYYAALAEQDAKTAEKSKR